MPKNRWRDWYKSLLGTHFDPVKHEELKETKAGMDDKVKKILKELEEKENGEKDPVVDLIEEFHHNYMSLYKSYDHLTHDLKKKAESKHTKKSASSSSSDSSDSDDSPVKESAKNGEVGRDIHGTKQELEIAVAEVADLQKKLAASTEEREALIRENENALSKLEEAQKSITDLKAEAENWSDENSRLLTENAGLRAELESSVAEFKEKLESVENERQRLSIDIEAEKEQSKELRGFSEQLQQQNNVIQLELESLRGESSALREKLDFAENELVKLTQVQQGSEEEKSDLSLRISMLEDELKQAEIKIQGLRTESSQISERLAERERELENFEAFKEKLDAADKVIVELNRRNSAAEEENNCLVLKVSELENLIKQSETEIQGLVGKLSRLTEKERELSHQLQTSEVHVKESEQKLEESLTEIAKLIQIKNAAEEDNRILSLKISEVENEIKESGMKIENFIAEMSQLNENFAEKEMELSGKLEIHVAHKEQLSTRLRDLELELDSSLTERSEFENKKNDELAELLQKLRDHEMRVEKKTNEVSELQIQVESLKEELASKNSDLEEKMSLLSQVKGLETDLDSTRRQRLELEEQLQKKSSEASEFLVSIESLKEEVQKLTTQQQNTLDETENLVRISKGFQSEIEVLTKLKNGWEEQLRSKSEEVIQLQDEMEKVKDKNSLTEGLLIEKNSELSALKKEHQDEDEKKSVFITDLTSKIGTLEEQLDSQKSEMDSEIAAHGEKISELLMQIEKLKEELSEKTVCAERAIEEKEILQAQSKSQQSELETLHHQISELENEESELMKARSELERKISELEKALAVQENETIAASKNLEDVQKQLEYLQADTIQSVERLAVAENSKAELVNRVSEQEKKLIEKDEEFTKLEVHFQDCKEKLESSASVIEELTRKLDFQIQRTFQLERDAEDLKRDLEMKVDEISSLIDNLNNAEVKEKLTVQRLNVSEQMLNEQDDIFGRKEARLQEEKRFLENKVGALLGKVGLYSEAQKKIVAAISDKAHTALSDIDRFHVKFEEDHCHLESRIYQLNNELKAMRDDIAGFVREAAISKEKMIELEREVQNGEEEKKSLMRSIGERDAMIGELEQRVKEKEVGYVSLSEEKREAIRQLCIWIEYHRDRYDDLKEIVVKRLMPIAATV